VRAGRQAGHADVADYRALRHALALLDRPPAQLVGRSLRELWAERAEGLERMGVRALETGTPQRYEQEARGRHFLSCIYAIDANTVVATGIDITAFGF
jgi:hypothetical protein